MVLSVNRLKITFGGKDPFTAVNNLSFHIERGKILAIAGESGSGKSLTALALVGLLPPAAISSGELLLTIPGPIKDQVVPLQSTSLYKLRGKDIGIIFQEPMSALNPVLTVGGQLKEGILTQQQLTNKEATSLAIDWLGKVQLPHPEKVYARYPHQLSGGQKQKVMIAMAMANHPALLIADEPTTALDTTAQQEIIRLMQFLQQEHQSAMMFITHDLELAASIADDLLLMYKGEQIEYGPAAEVLHHPKHPYTRALIVCRPSQGQKGRRLPVVADLMDMDINRPPVATSFFPQPEVQVAAPENIPLLTVNNLKIWFPESKNSSGGAATYFKAVDDVSFVINKGEILGLAGESGCGKSTLSRGLAGLLPVYAGSIIYKEQDLARVSLRQWKTLRKDLQMIFQDPYSSLNPRMNIGDALMEPMIVHDIVPRSALRKEAERLLELVQLPSGALGRYPHQFSGGQRQRIGIARALALRPKLLICDESVSALDVSIQAQILNLLKDLQEELGLTYLFISHDLAVVSYISDRIMIMQAGRVVEQGKAEEVMKNPKEPYTKKLIAAMPENISFR